MHGLYFPTSIPFSFGVDNLEITILRIVDTICLHESGRLSWRLGKERASGLPRSEAAGRERGKEGLSQLISSRESLPSGLGESVPMSNPELGTR